MLILRLIAVLMCATLPTLAQIPSYGIDSFHAPADRRWAGITARDVDAAYKLLLENHPGAAPALHDTSFQHRLAEAHAAALTRAHTVTSYNGYIFTLAGFATAMGDKHIWSRPAFAVAYPKWAGILLSKRGSSYVVTDTERPQASLLGAELLSCDNISAADLAQKNLGGFHADWTVGAQQTQAAPWLLVDEENPFIHKPVACVFSKDGKQQSVTLAWTRIKRETLLPRLKTAIGAGAAGFDVRKVGLGYWIALQDLSAPQTDDVLKAVAAQKDTLRRAPFVVVDLRGNGGGSSEVGREIANSLMGQPFVDARLGIDSQSNCGGADGAWRTSEDNINDMHYLLTTVLAGGAEAQRIFGEIYHDAKAARARGEEFSASIHCPPPPPALPVSQQPPSLMRGKFLLLTDNLCFSSCLAVTDNFRALGAFQIGQTTDAATHFTEVRETYLPSGYSLFSTLQSVDDPSGTSRVGPYEPMLPYNGDIANTAALEIWVVKFAVPAAH